MVGEANSNAWSAGVKNQTSKQSKPKSCLKERGTTFEKDCNLSSLESSSGIKRLNINESCQQAFLASNLNLTPY